MTEYNGRLCPPPCPGGCLCTTELYMGVFCGRWPPRVETCCNFNLHNYSCVDGNFYVIYNKLNDFHTTGWILLSIITAPLFSSIIFSDLHSGTTFHGDCECQHCVLSPNVPHKFHNSTSVIQVSPYSSIYSNLHLKWHACVG